MKFIFEQIDDYFSRAKVIGGWLVKMTGPPPISPNHRSEGVLYDFHLALAFVPDKNHVWKIEEEE